jgi:hypothetical protein
VSPAAKTDKAGAALKEGGAKPRQVIIRDKTFTIPADVPFAVLMAGRSVQKAEDADDDTRAVIAMLDLAAAYIGEEKLNTLVNGSSAEEGVEIIKELIDACKEEYGTDAGEASASENS